MADTPDDTRRGIVLVMVALGLLAMKMCAPPSYRAESIEAQVVDADSKAPLEGVVVTADWELRGWNGNPAGELQVLETVTDSAGRFRFPAWGPKPAGRVWWYLDNDDPRLCLLKDGYRPRIEGNTPRSTINRNKVRRSEWNGKVIELSVLPSSPKEQWDWLNVLMGNLEFAFKYDSCDWQHVPRMAALVTEWASRLEGRGQFSGSLPTLDKLDAWARAKGCGSLKTSLRGGS